MKPYSQGGETEYISFETDDHTYCIPCGIKKILGGDTDPEGAAERFDDINEGRDTSFKNINGEPFNMRHTDTIQFEQFPGEYLKDGLYCDECGTEIEPPQEDDEEEDEE